MSEYFTDEQNMQDLLKHMPEEERKRFESFGHNRVEPAFVNRVFIVYKPTGLTPDNRHRQPEILNLIKVIDFAVDAREGAYAVLKEQMTQQELTVTHVPKRLFAYPVYISVPPKLTLKWDGRNVSDKVWRSLSFAFLIKTKNKSSFYSKGNVYIETPNNFKRLYPDVTGQFSF